MRALLLLLAFSLSGCGEARSDASARAESRARRQEAATAHENKPPQVKTHSVHGGELVIIDVPVADRDGLTLDTQKCFVFRDEEFRTSNLSCPSRDTYLGGN